MNIEIRDKFYKFICKACFERKEGNITYYSVKSKYGKTVIALRDDGIYLLFEKMGVKKEALCNMISASNLLADMDADFKTLKEEKSF